MTADRSPLNRPRASPNRPWWREPAGDDRTVHIASYLLRKGYSPATVLDWLEQQ